LIVLLDLQAINPQVCQSVGSSPTSTTNTIFNTTIKETLMSDLHNDLPPFYSKYSNRCMTLYSKLFDPLNRHLHSFGVWWNKTFFVNESKFSDTKLDVSQAASRLYSEFHIKAHISGVSTETAYPNEIIVFVPTHKDTLWIPTSFLGYPVRVIVAENKL
jgi:hypothetical protein